MSGYVWTGQMRWLVRDEEVQGCGESPTARRVTVLQTATQSVNGGALTWHDVPTVTEGASQ